jgi:hypothetical protein
VDNPGAGKGGLPWCQRFPGAVEAYLEVQGTLAGAQKAPFGALEATPEALEAPPGLVEATRLESWWLFLEPCRLIQCMFWLMNAVQQNRFFFSVFEAL